jgi:hypothetical protein
MWLHLQMVRLDLKRLGQALDQLPLHKRIGVNASATSDTTDQVWPPEPLHAPECDVSNTSCASSNQSTPRGSSAQRPRESRVSARTPALRAECAPPPASPPSVRAQEGVLQSVHASSSHPVHTVVATKTRDLATRDDGGADRSPVRIENIVERPPSEISTQTAATVSPAPAVHNRGDPCPQGSLLEEEVNELEAELDELLQGPVPVAEGSSAHELHAVVEEAMREPLLAAAHSMAAGAERRLRLSEQAGPARASPMHEWIDVEGQGAAAVGDAEDVSSMHVRLLPPPQGHPGGLQEKGPPGKHPIGGGRSATAQDLDDWLDL